MTTEYQPYVGPLPYERKDQALFFGRDHEANELVSLIISSLEVLFYAQSGVGKTSLLNASVIPLLEEEGFEVLPLARVQGVIPKGIQPEEIQNIYVFNTLLCWAKHETNPGRLTRMTIREFLHNRKRPTDIEGQPLPRALIFDQFEEIFTLYQDRWNDRNEFFKQVRDALKDDNRLLRVIFTIREDYIAQLDPYAHLLPEKLHTRFRMERLRRDAALAAVTGPLRETKRLYAPGVAEKLVEELLKTRVETITSDNISKTIEVTGEFVEPVQLQVVCQNLWQELPQDVTEITEQHLLAFGDVDRQLSKFYESAVKEAATEAEIKEKELRQWCEKWLITSTGTRNIVHRGLQLTEGIPNAALDILETRHLINSEWRAGARWYELTHDRFIEPIRTSNESWRKEKVNQASLMIRQAEQSITIERYERTFDATRNGIPDLTADLPPTERYERALYAAKKALDLSEEAGDLQGEGLALFYIGKAYEGQKRFYEALTTYTAALEIVKQIDARELEVYLLESQGNLFFQMKEYKQAAQCFNDYIELIPDDPRGYYNRGRANRNLKKYKRAIEDYNHALELDPGYVYAFNGRGNAYSDLKEYEQAIEDYDQALELDPIFVYAYNGRGLSYYDLKKYERAIEDYDRALEVDPKYVDAYNNRGRAYYYLKEYERAIEDYNRALELDPKYVYAYNNMGLVFYALEQYERAIEDYNRALEVDPKYVDAYNNRGRAYYYLKEYERAIEDYNRALEVDPKYVYAYNNKGLVFNALEKYEQAIGDYDRALELDPKYIDAYYNRGLAHYDLKEYERAIQDYNRTLELDSKYVHAYNNRGLAYFNLKEYEQAIEDYNRTLELDPKYFNAYYNRGLAYSALEQYERAIEDYDRALELDPKYANAYYNRGLAYYNLKEYERAIEDYNRALELDPNNTKAYLMRGYTDLWQRDIKLAQIDFVQCCQLDSTNINYHLMVEWTTMCQEKPDPQIAERLEAVAANAPDDVEAFICRGVASWIRGHFEKAVAELDRAIPLNPELEDIFFWKGVVLAYKGQDDDARATIEKSIEMDLPPILLSPLRWTEQDRPDFYQKYAAPLLARFEI